MWTAERVQIVYKMWMDGESGENIAAHLDCGLTRNAVIGLVHRRKWKRAKTKVLRRAPSPSSKFGCAVKKRREPTPITYSAPSGINVKAANNPARPRPLRKGEVKPADHAVDPSVRPSVGPSVGPAADPAELQTINDRLAAMDGTTEDRVGFFNHSSNMCKWVVGDPRDLVMCGASRVHVRVKGREYLSPYCHSHLPFMKYRGRT